MLVLEAAPAISIQATLGRFRNPFLRHRPTDIAGNHAAEKTRRFVPQLRLRAALDTASVNMGT